VIIKQGGLVDEAALPQQQLGGWRLFGLFTLGDWIQDPVATVYIYMYSLMQ
jgi:hypothetical protein